MPQQPQALLVAGWQGRAGWSVPCGQCVPVAAGWVLCRGDPKRKGPKGRSSGCHLGRDATCQAARRHGLQMEEAAEEKVKRPVIAGFTRRQQAPLEQAPHEQSEAAKQ